MKLKIKSIIKKNTTIVEDIFMTNYSEDKKVKIPAAVHFLRLGYRYQPIQELINNKCLDSKTNVHKLRLKKALEKINNRKYDCDEFKEIVFDINSCIEKDDNGRAFHKWLTNPGDKVKLIDFEKVSDNDYAITCELPFYKHINTKKNFRPDIIILINGIPLSFLEVKKHDNSQGFIEEYDRTEERSEDFKKFFNMMQLMTFSNDMENDFDDKEQQIAGSYIVIPNTLCRCILDNIDGKYLIKYDKEVPEDNIEEIWIDCCYKKDIENNPEQKNNSQPRSPCNKFISYIYDKERFMDYIKNGSEVYEKKYCERKRRCNLPIL